LRRSGQESEQQQKTKSGKIFHQANTQWSAIKEKGLKEIKKVTAYFLHQVHTVFPEHIVRMAGIYEVIHLNAFVYTFFQVIDTVLP
jgi:hypothetical protein